jgi:dihydroorotate dehydrogenase (NAD+) catalytic subunit
MSAADALEFLLAGAVAVQLGTVNYVRPQAAREVVDGIAAYMEANQFERLSELSLRPPRVMAGV